MLLEKTDLSLALSDRAFKYIYHQQRQRLYDLAIAAFEERLPTIVVFEGWDAAGKGTIIRYLTRRLDPRGFKVVSTQAPQSHELMMPWLWRFWMQLPRRGQMAIFDRSWYGRVMIERVEQLTPIPDWIRAYEEINQFERTLADDNTLIVKFWLHISEVEQLRRFSLLAQDPARAWEVTAEDWERHRKYDAYLAAVRDMLNNTSTDYAPWTVIPATDPNYRLYAVLRTIINGIEAALGERPTSWASVDKLEEEAREATEGKAARKARKKQKKSAPAGNEYDDYDDDDADDADDAEDSDEADDGDDADNGDDNTNGAREGGDNGNAVVQIDLVHEANLAEPEE